MTTVSDEDKARLTARYQPGLGATQIKAGDLTIRHIGTTITANPEVDDVPETVHGVIRGISFEQNLVSVTLEYSDGEWPPLATWEFLPDDTLTIAEPASVAGGLS